MSPPGGRRRPGAALTLCFCCLVAVQCLETAFEVSSDDQSLAVAMTLPQIFSSATSKVRGQDAAAQPSLQPGVGPVHQ